MKVRRLCDEVMDIILDHDMAEGELGEFGRQIRRRRYTLHNEEYLEIPVEMDIDESMDEFNEQTQKYRYDYDSVSNDDEYYMEYKN